MKKIGLIVCIFLLAPVFAQGIPFSETTELKTYEDHYDLEKVVPIYIKEGSTYKTENRVVAVNIAPQDYCIYQGQELKDYYCDILVSVTIATTDKKISQEFVSYLNFDVNRQSLFWDHAGKPRADNAGELFGQNTPLVVKDQYLVATLNVTHLTLSSYSCGSCETDASSLIPFIDVFRLRVDITYTQSQLDIVEQAQKDTEKYEDAQTYITTAQQYFQQGEFGKAQDEFQKAKDLFDEMGDQEKSSDMQEWIDKCIGYEAATENFKEGMKAFEEAATINAYQTAIDTYENAKSYFKKAKTEFDRVEDKSKSDECQTWIDRCDDEIENLKGVGTLREKLIYVVVIIAVVAGGGFLLKQLGKGKGSGEAAKGMTEAAGTRRAPVAGMTLRARDAETGIEVSITVDAHDKIGKVRQLAATKLGMVPSALLYNGKVCAPDWTVAECRLRDGDLVEVVPQGMEPKVEPRLKPQREVYEREELERKIGAESRTEKLEKLEQMYREGKIPKELYESLKRKLENE